jgi:hypothetical protein
MPGTSLSGQSCVAAAEAVLIRRRIRNELPSDIFQPYPARALTALGIVSAIAIANTIIVFVPVSGPGSLLLSCLCGWLYASLFFLGHEPGHGQYSDPKQVNISLWRLHSLRFFCPRRYGACGTTRCITRTQIANPMTLTTSAHCHRSSGSDRSESSPI